MTQLTKPIEHDQPSLVYPNEVEQWLIPSSSSSGMKNYQRETPSAVAGNYGHWGLPRYFAFCQIGQRVLG